MRKFFLYLSLFALAFTAKSQEPFAVLDHIAIYVQNLDTSVAFYSKLFHFSSIPNPFPKARVKWFKIGDNIQFHLIEGAIDTTSSPFMHHLCLSVKSINRFIIELDRNSIPYYSGPDRVRGINNRADGVKQIFIKDPDKYWVEINNAIH